MEFNPGKKVKAMSPSGEAYFAYLPEPINKEFSWEDKRITTLLEEARGWLGELNAYSRLVPDVDFFIASHIAKEADQSSRIEGTKTTLEELYVDPEDFDDEEKVSDQEEVKNYIAALNYSVEKIQTPHEPPLSLRLICDAHRLLLAGVRGYKKHPGEVRKIQNKIGGSAGNLKDATFIPPAPEAVPGLLHDLEMFWHNNELEMPDLIKVALAHYQFETIHPFADGNGRIGRLIIILQLMSYGIMQKPTLYLSDYFEKNRAAYYDSLARVPESGDIEQWIRFFLTGVAETARHGKETLEQIIDLRAKYESVIEAHSGIKSKRLAKNLLKHLFSKPVVTARDVEAMLSISKPTATALVNSLAEAGILKEKTGYARNRVFVLHEYLGLFNNH